MTYYITAGQIDEPRLREVESEIKWQGKETFQKAGSQGWLWVDDDAYRFGPATHKESGVTCIISGRLALPAKRWRALEKLPYSGGLAGRHLLELYLRHGHAAVAPYNGAATVAIIDPRGRTINVWTDQFGYHPCFLFRGEQPRNCIVTTFPDLLVADSDVELTDDLVSMAEFLRAWRVTPPNTYFKEVKHAGAATQITIDIENNRLQSRRYWKPFDDEFYPDIDEAVDALSAAVHESIQERTATAKRPLFFVSGGADSRVLLFNAESPSDTLGVNLYERPSRETEVAEQLCDSVGAKFVAYQRDSDFYPKRLLESVSWSGGMWSVEDSHYEGFSEELSKFDPDLVMTACTTDWLFKGYGLEKAYVSLCGRNLPLFRYTDRRIDGFLPNVPLPAPPAFKREIADRMDAWFSGCPRDLQTPRDRLLVEDRRIRPTAYTVSVSGSIMYRKFPYDTFLADSRIASCYSRIHPDWKLNGELWGKVVCRFAPSGKSIVDSNFGWRLGAGKWEKLVIFGVGWIKRRLPRKIQAEAAQANRAPSAGSWPDMGWYALHSPTLRRMWDSVTTEERELITEIGRGDPWSKPLSDWASEGPHLMRIMTMLCFLRETSRRRQSSTSSK